MNENPRRFAELGYCLFPAVFDTAEVESNRRLLDEYTEDDRLLRPNYLGEPHASDERWLAICTHPRLLQAIEAILGPNLILVFSSVFIKPPGATDTVPWHQDNVYWPSVHGTDVVTVWVAIDDASEENSALEVIPGSHTGHRELGSTQATDERSMLTKQVLVDAQMESTAVVLEMDAGSVSIHDSFILHGSGANGTDRRRAGYTIRYCNPETAWVDLDRHPHDVYVVRGCAGDRGQGYVDLSVAGGASQS